MGLLANSLIARVILVSAFSFSQCTFINAKDIICLKASKHQNWKAFAAKRTSLLFVFFYLTQNLYFYLSLISL